MIGVLRRQRSPTTNKNGSVGTTIDSSGVGQAALNNSAVGPGGVSCRVSPAWRRGSYTLLPAKYATLPGAFRVTLASGSAPGAAGADRDAGGWHRSRRGLYGQYADRQPQRDARPVRCAVRGGLAAIFAIHTHQCQYVLPAARIERRECNAAAADGCRPIGAGRRPKTSGSAQVSTRRAAPGGAPAEIDIASQDIQITGNGETALAGYLQISADQLDGLDAGSLLIRRHAHADEQRPHHRCHRQQRCRLQRCQ